MASTDSPITHSVASPSPIAADRNLNIERSVTFTGRISDDALADLYARCRIFVMPSRDEGFGLVFLEAMRAGKPTVKTSNGVVKVPAPTPVSPIATAMTNPNR